jgi:putative nucleotidyltransferase with HDIG domain
MESIISTLFTMSHSISSSTDVDTAIDLILEKTALLMRAKFCVLRLLGKGRRKIASTLSSGLKQDELKIFSRFESSIYRKVLKTGLPIVISDVAVHFKKTKPAHLKKHGIHSVIMVPLFSNRRKAGVLAAYITEVRIFEKEDVDMFSMIAGLCALAIDNSGMLERVKNDYFNTIKTLAKIIDANDSYTRGHCDKVMKYSLQICKRMNLRGQVVNTIRTASLLHDIGKVGVDLSIIRKEGKLTEDDWKKIRMHPDIGAKIISQVGFLNDTVPIIKYHHERFAGGGYPDSARKGEKIPLGSRIIAVADAYDAMTSERPYRKAMSRGEAVAELRRCSGTQFDPVVVDAFTGRA